VSKQTSAIVVKINVAPWSGDVPTVKTDEWDNWLRAVDADLDRQLTAIDDMHPTDEQFGMAVELLRNMAASRVPGVGKALTAAVQSVRMAQAIVDMDRPVRERAAIQTMRSTASTVQSYGPGGYYGPGGTYERPETTAKYFGSAFAEVQAACVGGEA
jgi:hypothetical protein